MNRKRDGRRTLWLVLVGIISLTACAPLSDPASKPGHLSGLSTQADADQLGTGVALASDGNLYVAVREGRHVMLYQSRDLGVSWGDPLRVNATPEAVSANGENRPKVAIAQDAGLLVSWTRPLARRYTGEIRLARSPDGERFSPPIRVHRDDSEITHRFESMRVTQDGRVVLAWIDKRDLESAKKTGKDYRGAAVYVATSHDHGRHFSPEVKVADHSCECCRIAIAEEPDGTPLLFWRHVFEPNERDHALARLLPDGRPGPVQRATFDRWAIDACPHHGPGLAVDAKGTRHGVWFNVQDGEGQVFYGRLKKGGRVEGQRVLNIPRAAHADVAVKGDQVTLVWQAFDGERHRLYTQTSEDGGHKFGAPTVLADTTGRADQPRLAQNKNTLLVLWHTQREGIRVYPL